MELFAGESSFARNMINIIRAKEAYDPHPHPEDAFRQPDKFAIYAYCKRMDTCVTNYFLTMACKQKMVNGVVFSMAELFSELDYEDEYERGPFYSSLTPEFVFKLDQMLDELPKIYTLKELARYHHVQKKVCKFLRRKTGFNVYKTDSENRDEFAFDLSPILDL